LRLTNLRNGVPRMDPRLVVLQPSALCNLNCNYCYVPNRRDPALMTDEVLRASADFVFACGISSGAIAFHWHAGEPTAAGLEFYEHAFALLAGRAPAGIRVHHAIQTNGTLLTRKWCELFCRYQVEVGLSIDGPAEIHDRNRVTWTGKGTHAAVMAGYGILRQNGITPGAICVLAPESLRSPDQIYDFFKNTGFQSLAFNVEESEGVHPRSRLRDAAHEDMVSAYASFMRRFWQRWRADGSVMEIREFKQMLGCLHNLRADDGFVRELDEVIPFRILSIRRNGDVSTFSPELASTPGAGHGHFVLGNVLTDTPAQLAASAAFARLNEEVVAGRELCRQSCEHYALCGAGFQSNRFTEHGTFRAAETLTCRLHRKTLANVLIEELIMESNAASRQIS
jgi:uncharacterized protein